MALDPVDPSKMLEDMSVGLAKGLTFDTIGAPVDIVSTLLTALGVPINPNQVGSSKWLKQKAGVNPESSSGMESFGNILSSMISPETLVKSLPLVAGAGAIKKHGSAASFDKFSLDKIGTGEGAQAYGHGIYLTDSEKVGQHYTTVAYEANKARLFDIENNIQVINAKLRSAQSVQRGKEAMSAEERSKLYSQKNTLSEELTKRKEVLGKNLYDVELPDSQLKFFLDLDKPLTKQTPQVQEKLSQFVPLSDKTGADFYKDLVAKSSPQEASRVLDLIGIKGNIYLDQMSRAKGQGTYNYVVFNPEILKIEKKRELK